MTFSLLLRRTFVAVIFIAASVPAVHPPVLRAQTAPKYKGTLARYELYYYRMLRCSGAGEFEDSTKMTLQLDQTSITLDASGAAGCPFMTFNGTLSFSRPQAEVTGSLDAERRNLVFDSPVDPITATMTGAYTTRSPLDSLLETGNLLVVIDHRGAEANISKCQGGTDFKFINIPAPGSSPVALSSQCTPLGLSIVEGTQKVENGELVSFEATANVYGVIDVDAVYKGQVDDGELSHLCFVNIVYSFGRETGQLELVFDPPEIRCGESSAVKVRVLDDKGALRTDYDGGVKLRVDAQSSTKDISRMQSEQSLLITKGETQWVFIFTPKEPFDAGRAITSTTPLSGTLVLEAELENSSLPKRKGTLEVRSPLDFSPGRIEVQQGIADRDKTVSIEFSPGVTRSFDPLPLIADHATIIRVFPEYTNPNSIPFSSVASLDGFSAEVRIDRDGSPVATMALDRCPNGEPYVFKDAYQNAEQTSLRNALGDVIPANLLTAAGQYTFSVILKNTTAVRERIADLANNTKDVDETFVRTKPISLLLTTGYASGESAPAADVRDWQEIKTLMPVEAGRVSFTDPARSLQQFSSTRSDMSFGSLSRMLTLWNQNNPSDQRQYHIMFATMPVVDGICRTPGAGGCAMSVNATIAVIQWQNQRGAVHELGHLLGLSDTYTTPMYPTYSSEPNPRRIGATDGGNRIQDGNINLLQQPLSASGDGNVMRDLMGVGPWIDRVEWDYLYRQRFRLGGPRVAPEQPLSGRYIVIAGIVSKNDVVHFDPFTVMETVPIVTDSSSGNYAVIFEDGGGRKLQRREVPIFFHVPGGGDRDTVQFAWTFPLPESTARITLARIDGARDVELARRIFSAGTPTVRVLAPKNGPQLAGDVIVRWSAADPDGDPMTYDILYSPDGVEQMVAAVLVRDTQCVINTRTLRTSASAHFTVIANDGVNEGRARSETVSVTHVDQRDDPFTPAGTRPSIETLYPNPAADRVIIRCTLPQAGHTRVTLTDLLGRIVAVVADQEKSAGVFELNVPLFDLPAGLYLVTLEANGKRITKTLLHRER